MWSALIGGALGLLGQSRQQSANIEQWRAQVRVDDRRLDEARQFAVADRDLARRQQLRDVAQSRQWLLADNAKLRRQTVRDNRQARNWQLADNATARQQYLADDLRNRGWQVADNQLARQQSLEDQATYFQRTRDAAERAGFNPLTVMGMLPQGGGYAGAGGTYSGGAGGGGGGALSLGGTPSASALDFGAPPMAGSPSVALGAPAQSAAGYGDAYAAIGEGIGSIADAAAANNDLVTENQALQRRIRDLTIRPKVSGVYASSHVTPSIAEATNGPVSQGVSRGLSSGGDGLRFGGLTLPFDPETDSAEKAEARYGDVGAAVYGMGVLSADAVHAYKTRPDPKKNSRPWSSIISAGFEDMAADANAAAIRAYRSARRPEYSGPVDRIKPAKPLEWHNFRGGPLNTLGRGYYGASPSWAFK